MRPTSRRGNSRLTLAVVSLALVLGACENVKDQLGLNKSSPDEFAVLTRAPLTLPPDYKLRPPDPGAVRPQEVSVQERVKAALYNTSPEGAGNASTATVGESALLSRAGSSVAGSGPTATVGESALLSLAGSSAQQSNIRAVINRDNAIFAEEDGNFVDALIFWRDPEDSSTIVDPAREDQRLQEAEATGEAPNAGETAVIERRNQGLLEGLF